MKRYYYVEWCTRRCGVEEARCILLEYLSGSPVVVAEGDEYYGMLPGKACHYF